MSTVFAEVKVNGKPLYAVREIDQSKGTAVGVIVGDASEYEIVRERQDIGYQYVEVRGVVEYRVISND